MKPRRWVAIHRGFGFRWRGEPMGGSPINRRRRISPGSAPDDELSTAKLSRSSVAFRKCSQTKRPLACVCCHERPVLSENTENAVEWDPNRFGNCYNVKRHSSEKRSKVKGVYRCPKRNKRQNKSVEAKPYRYWGLLDCHCHWRAPRLRSLEDRQ